MQIFKWMPLKAEEQIMSTTPTQESPISTNNGQPSTNHSNFSTTKQDHQMDLDLHQPSVQESDKENRERESVEPAVPTIEHSTTIPAPETTTITNATPATKAVPVEESNSNSVANDRKLDETCMMDIDGCADESRESTHEDLSSIALMVTNQIVTKVSTYLDQTYFNNQPQLF